MAVRAWQNLFEELRHVPLPLYIPDVTPGVVGEISGAVDTATQRLWSLGYVR